MKSFLLLSLILALVTTAVALLSGLAADHLLGQWKADQAGWLYAVVGFFLAAINQTLVFPARVLSVGSNSAALSFVALATCFSGWGLAFAALWRRASRIWRTGA
jgi:hypothetical protein